MLCYAMLLAGARRTRGARPPVPRGPWPPLISPRAPPSAQEGALRAETFTLERDSGSEWSICKDYGYDTWCHVPAQSGTPPAAGWRVSEGRPGPPPTVVVVMMTDDDKSHAATADAASS